MKIKNGDEYLASGKFKKKINIEKSIYTKDTILTELLSIRLSRKDKTDYLAKERSNYETIYSLYYQIK